MKCSTCNGQMFIHFIDSVSAVPDWQFVGHKRCPDCEGTGVAPNDYPSADVGDVTVKYSDEKPPGPPFKRFERISRPARGRLVK